MTTRSLVYYIATSVDHYIADKTGGFDGFLTEGHHIADYINSLQDYDTVLMGKNTYEVGYRYGMKAGEPSPTYAHMMQYVFSTGMEAYRHEQLHVIQQDPAPFVTQLKSQTGKAIYLCGGGKLAGYLLNCQLIDTLILKVNPFLMGDGIPLFAGVKTQFALSLQDSKIYRNGVAFMGYHIEYH